MELKSRFDARAAEPAHEGTILSAPVLPEGMDAPFGHAWGCLRGVGSMAAHRHPEEEVYMFFKGEGYVDVDGTELAVSNGDVVRIPRDAMHSVINRRREELVWAAFWW